MTQSFLKAASMALIYSVALSVTTVYQLVSQYIVADINILLNEAEKLQHILFFANVTDYMSSFLIIFLQKIIFYFVHCMLK